MPRKKPEPVKIGRPPVYRPEFNDQAHRLCLLGYTDERLAEFFGVSSMTINRWKRERPGFWDAVKSGKDDADGRVASALMQRALGYSHPEVDIKVVDGQIVQTPIVKHYPPDTAAAAFWLTNRQPERWKAKRAEAADGDSDAPVPVKVVVEVKDARREDGA